MNDAAESLIPDKCALYGSERRAVKTRSLFLFSPPIIFVQVAVQILFYAHVELWKSHIWLDLFLGVLGYGFPRIVAIEKLT